MAIVPKTMDIVIKRSIIINDGVVDKKEFDHIYRTLLSDGMSLFPMIKKLITSDESPDTFFCKHFPLCSEKNESLKIATYNNQILLFTTTDV
ncbi:MAG: hypothetical protein ABIG42_08255 [bacterium]